MNKNVGIKERKEPISRIEEVLLDIGFKRFPESKHPLRVYFWDATGTIAYHCGRCNKDHYVDLTDEEKQFLANVNLPKKDEDRPYIL